MLLSCFAGIFSRRCFYTLFICARGIKIAVLQQCVFINKNMKQAYLAIILMCVFNAAGQVPDWAWAKTNSGGAGCEARGMAIDQSGNIYVTGYFSGSSAVFASATL